MSKLLKSAALEERDVILIISTVPETITTILKGQPKYLSRYFRLELVTSSEQDSFDIFCNEGVRPHEVQMTRGIAIFSDIFSIFNMIRLLYKLKPAVVHSYTPKAGLVGMVSSWLCRVPVRVHTFTGLIFPTSHGFRKKLLIWIDRLICACATHIVPEGQGVKSDLECFQITRKPLHVIGYGNIAGVDTSYFSPMAPGMDKAGSTLRARLTIDDDALVFCFVGRLNKDKGLGELMHAFVALPPAAHLLLVGEVDQTAPVAPDLLAAIGSHPCVHALGFLGDVRPALRAANVLVLPSYREGFPNVVLQAGAMALPVIATDINGCNEVIEPGFNGWLVPARDAAALERVMHEAMQMLDAARKDMGLRARERIQQRFEQQHHWERMVAFYQGLLGSPKRASK